MITQVKFDIMYYNDLVEYSSIDVTSGVLQS
jgi:hypothetical protein